MYSKGGHSIRNFVVLRMRLRSLSRKSEEGPEPPEGSEEEPPWRLRLGDKKNKTQVTLLPISFEAFLFTFRASP